MTSITITHIRRGFATNSSSTHSILEVTPGQNLPEPYNFEWGNNHIEYDDFIVSDKPSRIKFLHAMAAYGARYSGDWRNEDECYRRYMQLADVIPGEPLSREEMCDVQLDNLSGYAVPLLTG